MPARSKSQARFMRAVASGKVKKPGLSREKAREFVSGYSTKDLPEKAAKPMGKRNATVAMRVSGIRAVGPNDVCVELSSSKPDSDDDDLLSYDPKESSARLHMPKGEAKNYPVGSMVAIHCLPAGDVKKESATEKVSRMAKETVEEEDE